MAKNFEELRAKMSPESLELSEKYFRELLAEMPLHEFHQAQALLQKQLAEKLHINQDAVSKMEKDSDLYICSLRETIQTLGGDLEIIATFPDGSVKIDKFSQTVAD